MIKFIFERSFSMFSAVPLIITSNEFAANGFSLLFFAGIVLTTIFMAVDNYMYPENKNG